MDKKLVQEQFGVNAREYINSRPHAKGASLQRLVELVEPQPHWQALDIATATGHTPPLPLPPALPTCARPTSPRRC